MYRFTFCTCFMALLCINAFAQPLTKEHENISIPKGYTILAEQKGDLDKDGIPELVIVFNTPKQVELGTERQIWIYKRKAGKWAVWHKSTGAVLSSQHGGMMGDPFDGLEIDHGVIVIRHFGGSADKWFYVHRYRYQKNNWYLIGTNITFGRPPDQMSSYDYNLSTGKVVANIDKNNEGDNSTKSETLTYFNKTQKPVLMDGIKTGENEVKVPRKHESFYF